MNKGQRQVIAEMIASTVRVLELLRFPYYEVTPPKNERKKGNKSPRVVYVYGGPERRPEDLRLRIYNSASGNTWANDGKGKPVDVGSMQELYEFLSRHPLWRLRRRKR